MAPMILRTFTSLVRLKALAVERLMKLKMAINKTIIPTETKILI